MPLGRIYRGSYYEMSHRSTIVTRVYMVDEGIVGEAYAGDEDAGLLAIIHGEIAPRLIGADAMSIERCWELSRGVTLNILRDRRLGLVAQACVDSALWDAIGKALAQPLWRLWGGYRNRLPMISIGGYYDGTVTIAEEIAELREAGMAGMKFKVGAAIPRPTPSASARRARAGGSDFILAADANQGWTRDERLLSPAWSQTTTCAGSRSLAAGTTIAGRCVTCARGPRRCLRRPNRVLRVRMPGSDGRRRDRRVQLRCLLVGRPDRVATGRQYGAHVDVAMGHHEEPQVAAHLLALVSNGTYVECCHPDRDPIWRNLIANRPKLVDGRAAAARRAWPRLGAR
ncbi:D-galactonate dehydratase [Capillimicrobium parvum]|uniref:D-galactonate dehydratase n=1 Tax=Capillimicrobium parvum TaxID=2884022 RepID=A0A9E6Y1P1_9ACTN|nr:mandelate racemase/muconate lactonizing enzyme family protein [Capillimicrobium parvum]UGS38321.1 D-galactonate dehydratase [Capillimicrobium parvum]